MSRARVLVTGVGAVTPFGTGADVLFDALIAGRSAISSVDVEGFGALAAGVVDEADAAVDRFGVRDARRMSRAGRLAALAASEALAHAGLAGEVPEGTGSSVACVHGGAEALLDAQDVMRERSAERVWPLTIPLGLTNSACAATARALRLTGPSLAVTTACAAGSDAIGLAAGMIRDGRADVVVAGGAEAAVSALIVAGYASLGALSTGAGDASAASRPFDAARSGFVMAEGAGMVVLESERHALERGATPLAVLAGYGQSCDAGHLTDPDPKGEGAARAVSAALADAGVGPGDVAYVNAHATSTPSGDVAEARALARAGVTGAAVSSTKGAHGHTLGAAGGIEAVVTVLAVVRGEVPPTLNLTDPDPDAPLDHVVATRRMAVPVSLSNSFGFGGHNAALVFTAP